MVWFGKRKLETTDPAVILNVWEAPHIDGPLPVIEHHRQLQDAITNA